MLVRAHDIENCTYLGKVQLSDPIAVIRSRRLASRTAPPLPVEKTAPDQCTKLLRQGSASWTLSWTLSSGLLKMFRRFSDVCAV